MGHFGSNFGGNFDTLRDELKQISEGTVASKEQTLKRIEEKLDKFIERDQNFKRNLLRTISEMHQRQELTLDGYDKIKAMADEWLGQD